MKALQYIIYTTLVCGVISCKRFVDVPPTDKTTKEITFSSIANATNAVNGLYANFSLQGNIYSTRLYTDISLMSDEIKTSNPASTPFAENSVTPQLDALATFWSGHYAIINNANIIIDNLPSVPGIQPAQLAGWTGEAKCIRAFCYMQLTQLFGKVPKVTSSLWSNNAALPRSPVTDIQDLILKDLQDAESGLPHNYTDAEQSRIKITKGAAIALQVKYYMLKQDWTNAVAKATALINDSTMYKLEPNYANVFTSNSIESIWELWFGGPTLNGAFSAFVAGARAQYGPSTKIVLAFNASTGDLRSPVSIAAGKVNKYTTNTSRTKLLRLADIYLLRAEAKAQQNDIAGSTADLNRIRSRAGLAPTTANDKASLLLAIEQERFLELAFEGQRWFDLVRTGRADAVIAPLKPQTWTATDVLLPVPQSEINLNPNLLPQNPPF